MFGSVILTHVGFRPGGLNPDMWFIQRCKELEDQDQDCGLSALPLSMKLVCPPDSVIRLVLCQGETPISVQLSEAEKLQYNRLGAPICVSTYGVSISSGARVSEKQGVATTRLLVSIPSNEQTYQGIVKSAPIKTALSICLQQASNQTVQYTTVLEFGIAHKRCYPRYRLWSQNCFIDN